MFLGCRVMEGQISYYGGGAMRHSLWVISTVVILLAGCSLLRQGRGFTELGPVEAQACRHFVLAIIPWGKSDFGTAVDKALVERGGDALLNVTVETSLYGFIPMYNVYSFTCTTVRGIAIKFE